MLRKVKIIFPFLLFLNPLNVYGDILEGFDSLGGNDVLINRVQLSQPDKKVKIVQDRTVDLHSRSEFSIGYGNVIGGDAYLQSQMLQFSYYFHINPRWSVGLSYFDNYNSLTKEGRFLIHYQELVPDLDQPDSGYEFVGNFSPIYGKINLFDRGVLQFDVYLSAAYGFIDLKSGNTNILSAGGGVGFWISQHLSSRLELRQRFYEAQRFNGPVTLQTTLASISVGYLF